MAEGAGLPYVGSLMSLVTHGGVRYEGVLSSIDMPNSAITLSGGMLNAYMSTARPNVMVAKPPERPTHGVEKDSGR